MNFLWICTDSQRYDTLGCNGNPFVKTPNIDKLADEGANFSNVFSQSPLCSPSRGCFLSGRYPVTMGLRQNGQCIKPNELLVPKILSDAGYTCGLVGKLHLSACDYRIERYGKNDWWRYPPETYFDGIEKRIDDGYSEFEWDHAPNPLFKESSYNKWLAQKGESYRVQPCPENKHVFYGMPEELHQTKFCADKAISFIERNAGEPWLYSVNIFDPHFSFDPPKEYLDRYNDFLDEIPLPEYRENELELKPTYQSEYINGRNSAIGLTDRELRQMKAAYWAMVDLIDVQVGRILATLKSSGQDGNTVVIYTSDHGEMLGDHRMLKKGALLYDCAVHVPLIMRCPTLIPSEQKIDCLYELGDLAPTIVEAAGLPVQSGMQLKSFWKEITGDALQVGREDVYCEYMNANPDKKPQYLTMVRSEKFKIVVHHGEELGELYDLENDPKEFNNLWFNKSYENVKLELMKRVCDRLAFNADPLPERIGIY